MTKQVGYLKRKFHIRYLRFDVSSDMINNSTYKALLNSSGVVVAVFNKFKAFGSSICSMPSLNHKNGNTISRSPLAGLISGWGSLSLILICDRACTRSPVPNF